MTPERWAKLKKIFGDALEREPAERDGFVRNAAKDDPELLSELLRYLAENERDSELLSKPALAGARAPSPDEGPRFAPSAILARRFRIVRFIARGGMGEVYEAEDLELGERVALKTVRQRVAPDADLRAMFKREIQLARRVTHPNVCRIFDLAHHEDPEHGGPVILLSMQLIEGRTLAEHLRLGGPMSFREALPLIEEIASGLQAVHDAGIIHGDLKPGNVMLVSRPGDDSPHAVVMDFGMALPAGQGADFPRGSSDRAAEAAPLPEAPGESPTITVAAPPGWILRGGTPEYFAPEQTAGGPATTATDVYAFALVIAEMLGVPRPFRLKPEAERMPSRGARALRRCLESDPSRRYAQPAELAGALRASVNWRPRVAIAAAAVLIGTLGIATALYLAKHSDGMSGKGSRLLLTEGAVTVRCPSPDGRWLAATSWDTGDLVLREAATGKIRRLTHKPTTWDTQFGGAYDARFSPDGKQVVYEWMNSRTDGELRIIGTDGSGDRMLYRNGASGVALVDWSPDGAQILLRLFANDDSRLALLSANDGSLRVLERNPSVAALGNVRFGKDAATLVFDSQAAGKQGREIRRLSMSGAESTLVGRSGDNSIIGWSPDRTRLIFSSDRRGHAGIWAVPVSRNGAEGEAAELVSDARGWEPLGITRSGSLIYRNEIDSTDVYTAVLDLSSNRTISAPQRVTERFTGTYNYPNWSEDGRQLVFDSNQYLPTPALTIFDTHTGKERELRLDLRYAWRPQWTEHGAAIMVAGAANDGRQGQFRIDARTGEARLTLPAKEMEIAAAAEGVWSPDGKQHFNRYRDFRRGIFRWSALTRERRVLYVPPAGVDLGTENLALSPDRRWLAFQARNDAEGTSALMVISAEGGEARALLTIRRPEVFSYGSFTWAPDSRRILAARSTKRNAPQDEMVSEIWQVPLDGAAASKIDFPAMWVQSLRLSRDGKTLAFAERRRKTEVWLLQNFL